MEVPTSISHKIDVIATSISHKIDVIAKVSLLTKKRSALKRSIATLVRIQIILESGEIQSIESI